MPATRLDRLSVIIPTLNAGAGLSTTLASVDGAGEVIVVDGGSSDGGPALAAAAGATVLMSRAGRGVQLAAGADAATGDWFLFLHSDTGLADGWRGAVSDHMQSGGAAPRAGYFRFALDDAGWRARLLERLVAWRCALLALPYGDQGLLISRDHYEQIGGYRDLALMEDVDLVRRIGRGHLAALPVAAVTSAVRWRRDGWLRRSLRNLSCLALYAVGVSPARIARLYER
ncbi:MAG: TIGR04283 family arsenosugar biosynthesis glycosyltransferase [Caulobacter sp.]|nr:TIGR04283 family arsenosugar biosynthesis glycosyltransferase [Caulobacter sp.]